MLTALLTFALAAGLIVLLPGPDTLVVLRNLLRHGRRRAALTVAGILTGLTVWIAVAALGLSAVLRASTDAYAALRIAGAAYLLWLGIQSLRARRPAPGVADALTAGTGGTAGTTNLTGAADPPDAPTQPIRRALLGSGFGSGLATDLLNPKVGVFFVTFLPGFVPRGESVGTTTLLLGGVFVVETLLYFTALLLLAGRITGWMANPRVQRRLDRATGLVLVGFGVRLAVEP